MAATEYNRIRKQRRFRVKQACALWPVKLVRADGNQIRVELADAFNWLLAEPLHRVGVKNNAALPADHAEFGDGLDCADFIVRRHHRYQNRVRADRPFQIVRRNPSVRIHRQPCDFKAFLFFEVVKAVKHRVVLNGRSD